MSCKSPSLYLGARLTVFDETKQKRSQQRSDRSGALQRLPAASAQNFAPVNSFGILIDTSSTFTSRSTFQKKSAGNRRFRSVGASGVAKFAVFACHLAPTSAAAGGLLRAHARAARPRQGRSRAFAPSEKSPNRIPACAAATAALLRSFLSNPRRKPSHGRLDMVKMSQMLQPWWLRVKL